MIFALFLYPFYGHYWPVPFSCICFVFSLIVSQQTLEEATILWDVALAVAFYCGLHSHRYFVESNDSQICDGRAGFWVLGYAEIQCSFQFLSCTIIRCLVKYHAEGGADCCLHQYHSLHKLSDPGSVEMNRSISKVITSMVYLPE